MRAGTTPLSVDVQYLPIHLWERWRGEPFDTESDFHTILPYARAMNLAFWWLLLGYGTAMARTFGGPWAGRFAVVLLATEPNLLAHAAFAMTDISVTAMILVFAYHYYHGRAAGRVRRWVVPGILYGLAMTAKASALTFVPLVMVAFEVPRWRAAGAFAPPAGVGRVRHFWRASAAFRADFWKVLAVGTVVVWAYCGTDWRPQPSFVKLADGLPEENRWAPAARWLAHNVSVFPNAGEAFAYQIKHNIRGHGSNLLGTARPRGVWYYFPVALAVKLTLPVLLLPGLLLLTRPRALFTPLGLVALFLFAFSFNCRVQIGVRLVFPFMAFLILAIATALARASAGWQKRWRTTLLGIIIAVSVYPPVLVWPDGLRYSNELWGGPENTYKYLGDSNYDWGQGLKDLDRWIAQHGLPEASVWYYGMDPVIRQDNDRRLLALHNGKLYDIQSPPDVWKYVRGKVVAVGFTMLYGCPPITPTMPPVVEFFHGQQPIGRSRTFLVYDFRNVPDPP
jgi:hypothetical protein